MEKEEVMEVVRESIKHVCTKEAVLGRIDERLDTNDEVHKDIKDSLKDIWNSINGVKESIDKKFDKYNNRLPVWATVLIGILMGAVAWFAKK